MAGSRAYTRQTKQYVRRTNSRLNHSRSQTGRRRWHGSDTRVLRFYLSCGYEATSVRGDARGRGAVYLQPRGLEVYACHIHAGNIPTRGVPSNVLARGEHSKIDSRLRSARGLLSCFITGRFPEKRIAPDNERIACPRCSRRSLHRKNNARIDTWQRMIRIFIRNYLRKL